MSYGPIAEGTLDFATTNPQTLGPYTAVSEFKPAIDQVGMGGGDTINVSVQRLKSGGTVYTEIDNFTLSTPIAPPADPAQDYIPTPEQKWYGNPYGGIKFILTYTAAGSNALPTSIYYDVTQGF